MIKFRNNMNERLYDTYYNNKNNNNNQMQLNKINRIIAQINQLIIFYKHEDDLNDTSFDFDKKLKIVHPTSFFHSGL